MERRPMTTRHEALLDAIQPLRQADFSLVRETLELVNFPTPTATTIKAVVNNLVGYLETEKELPEFNAEVPQGEQAKPKKRRVKRAKR